MKIKTSDSCLIERKGVAAEEPKETAVFKLTE